MAHRPADGKDTGIEPFASLLPWDETKPIRLKVVRIVEVAAAERPPSLVPGKGCRVATFCCPGCGVALRCAFGTDTDTLVGATMCTVCFTALRVRLPPRRPFLALPRLFMIRE